MKASSRLLLVSFLAVVLLAPSAYPQNTQSLLNDLTRDLINLRNQVGELQKSSDQKNADLLRLMEQVLGRFSAVDASVQKLNESLGGIRTDHDRTSKDLQQLQQIKTSMDSLNGTVRKMEEGLTSLQNAVGGVNRRITELQTKSDPLPTAQTLFQEAFGSYSAGYYDLAVSGFRDFLRNYPNDERADGAQIFIGESLYQMKKFDEALVEYDMAFQNYPKSGKRCLALYKKGLTHVALKQTSQATEAFEKTAKECPGSTEASNAAAELKTLAPPPPATAAPRGTTPRRGRGN